MYDPLEGAFIRRPRAGDMGTRVSCKPRRSTQANPETGETPPYALAADRPRTDHDRGNYRGRH